MALPAFTFASESISTEPTASESTRLKAQITGVWGDGINQIGRLEGWIKHQPGYLDLKVKFEDKDGNGLQKHRIQFMPVEITNTDLGLAYRYKKKENSAASTALGLAIRVKGKNWKIPLRYYPELNLFHSKPVYKQGNLRADLRITYDHQDHSGSMRPGIDWKIARYFSFGIEARIDDNSDKNYVGVRLKLIAKN